MANITKIYVGVDVSKKKLDVHFLPLKQAFSVDNTQKGIKKFIDNLKPYDVEQVVCEASGGYEILMLKTLNEHGFKTWQVEPKRIKAFIYSKGRRAKTDAIDAAMIALFASQETNKHEVTYEKNSDLHALVNRKKDIVEMIGMEKLRLEMPQENCKNDIKKHIIFMQKQIKSIGKQIDKVISNDGILKKKIEILESMPGIGKTSAAIFIAELPELGNIENRQIASLVGVAPHPHESGQSTGKYYTAGGRHLPRTTLFMVALVASRHNVIFKEFYDRLIKSGKKPKVALGALMRKIIVILNVMLKNETFWNENVA